MPIVIQDRFVLPIVAAIGMALAVTPAFAGTAYTCSNAELLRVACSADACEVLEEAILTVAIDGYDRFTVCGEALCWSGAGARQVSGAYEIVTGVGLKWDMRGEGEPNDAVLAFDPKTGMGTILAPHQGTPLDATVRVRIPAREVIQRVASLLATLRTTKERHHTIPFCRDDKCFEGRFFGRVQWHVLD